VVIWELLKGAGVTSAVVDYEVVLEVVNGVVVKGELTEVVLGFVLTNYLNNNFS
jgi:hypothetical protein